MADSDGEYIQDISDDEINAHQVTRRAGPGTRASGARNRGSNQVAQQTWEVRRTWENVVEGADGTISSTVEGLLEAGKRKRSVMMSFGYTAGRGQTRLISGVRLQASARYDTPSTRDHQAPYPHP